jgi:putative membrane protein
VIWDAIFAYLHYMAIGLTAGLLLAEHWLLKRPLDRAQVRLLGTVDLGYFLAAIAVLATGLARVLYFGKGTGYYLANHLFWVKMAVFLVVGLASIPPTLQFIRWNREARSQPTFAPLGRELDRVRACIALELGLLALLPLLATMIARGFGL